MPDPNGEPWNGVYNGFSVAAPPRPRPKSLPIPKGVTVGAGVAIALGLGLLVGLFAKPDLATTASRAPMRPVAIMPVVVNPATPETPLPVKAVGKLEVLPADMARAANSAPARPSPPAYADLAPAPLPVSAPQPAAPAEPACAGLRGRAAQLVCADPELADADREMARAYRRALRSGVSPEEIQADQRDWLAAREETARRAPREVADLYEQRIDELNQLAEEEPR